MSACYHYFKVEPLQMSLLPTTVWHEIAIDIYGSLANGQYILVIIDSYSRYPDIALILSTSARNILALENIFFSL